MVEATIEDKYSIRKDLWKNFKKSISKQMSIKYVQVFMILKMLIYGNSFKKASQSLFQEKCE